MREKNQSFWRKVKVALIVVLVLIIVYGIMNRVAIKDYLMTYFL